MRVSPGVLQVWREKASKHATVGTRETGMGASQHPEQGMLPAAAERSEHGVHTSDPGPCYM